MRKVAWSVIACSSILVGFVSPVSAQDAALPAGAAPQSAAQAAPPPPAAAQTETPAPSRPVTITGGVDVTTSYIFRGIPQEHDGFIAQPWIDLGATVYRGDGALKSLSVNVGNWDSQHSGPTGKWYEADYYASATFTFGRLKPGALFTSYTSPNDRFATVQELAAVLSIDDSTSRFPLSPKAILAFELDGQADGGTAEGTYLELGIRPSLKLAKALSVAIPAKVGLGLRNYYEGPTGANRFGYFDAGAIASVPFTSGSVSWDIHGGVDFIWFGDNMKLLNGGDGFKPVGSIGIAFSY